MAGSNDPLNLQSLIDASNKEDSDKNQKSSASKKRRVKKSKKSSSAQSVSDSSSPKPRKEKRKKIQSSSGSDGEKKSPQKVIVNKDKTLAMILPEKPVVTRKSDDTLIAMTKRYHNIPTKRAQKANWGRFGRQVATRPVVADFNDVWDVTRVRGMRRPKYVEQTNGWAVETSNLFNQRIELEKMVQAKLIDLRFSTLFDHQNELADLFVFFKKVYEPEGW